MQEYVQQAYGTGMSVPYQRGEYYGLFYGGGGRLLASQVVGILAIVGWVCGLTGILFFVLKMFNLLRISEEDEHRGLDASKHGGSAYNHDVNGRTVGVRPKGEALVESSSLPGISAA
ncbi:ammonium transporter [Haematococcus lacustris]|uniref:Ammonium transporter n=1 Tax=Haematococcus lacustris TaxID=44745 RepID=A0A699YI06_HAELA|nr:ammonium transporter [Haematococcus lacustris]